MPENNLPAQNPTPEAAPGEFDFTQPPMVNPRVKRRSLKAKPSTPLQPAPDVPPAARELEHEAPPLTTPAKTSAPAPREHDDAPAKAAEPAPASRPPASRPFSSTVRPTSGSPSSPHGTRPATLYYSQSKKKEETPSMKPTSSPAPSSNPAPSASSASSRTSTAASASSSTSSVRPSSVVDYRANVERQSREQKSVGNVLSILVYTLVGFFVVGTVLAGYGAYVVHKALYDQSVTVSDLDARYKAATDNLNVKLAAAQDSLNQAGTQINRQQDMLVKQQESINKLINSLQDTTTALKLERQSRSDEASTLRARIKALENQEARGQTTRQY